MNNKSIGIQNQDPRVVAAQARLLMSEGRQRQQNRQQSMLQRAGIEESTDS
ncbi:hypothetical protein [Gloeocapsopsis dulcis]|uniref:hypothetical protein n=1 Tax=Gloeocapsopsis dulcis TaxID=2859516 RepID=UPI0018C76C4B|nr:hypothetical protein [Gloeocapsopsis dulcis]WNN89070.1 hypothetical protein P0S91_22920 [Gloeocapsopsis dulcis]